MTKKKWHQIYWLDFLWVHPATVRQSYYYDYCYVLAAAGVAAAACEAAQWCFKPHFIWLEKTRIIVNCTLGIWKHIAIVVVGRSDGRMVAG